MLQLPLTTAQCVEDLISCGDEHSLVLVSADVSLRSFLLETRSAVTKKASE